MLKDKKGITLIALVITIIILLILAATTTVALVGNNSIILRAVEAKEKMETASIIEEIQTDILEEKWNNEDGNITDEVLKTILEKYGTIQYEEDGTTIKGIITGKNYEIRIDKIVEGIK